MPKETEDKAEEAKTNHLPKNFEGDRSRTVQQARRAAELENRKEYVLKTGQIHTQYLGGVEGRNKVFLTDEQFRAFSDKFESQEELKQRQKLEKNAADANAKLDEVREALANQGMTLEQLLAQQQVTVKKPDPQPSVGTAEPAPANVTPAPVGSTSDPVNKAPATAGGKENPAAETDPNTGKPASGAKK
jgi:hypothetical protein